MGKKHTMSARQRELQRTRETQRRQRAQRRRFYRRTRNGVIAVICISVLIYGVVLLVQRAQRERLGEHHAIQGRDHIRVGERHDAYATNPPTSGAHGAALPWGVSAQEVVDENAVHNLEHGGIWITYKDLDDAAVAQLQEIARRHPQSVLLSPRSANDAPIAVASWGRLMKLDRVDVAQIETYIRQNINKSPEPLAR